jgi:multicomponent Na+:H+ antiporter subunit G
MSGLGGALLVIGTFFICAATIGFVRLPDIYTRMHAVSKADTLGALLSMLGLACLAADVVVGLKFAVTAVFIFVANPVAAHALSRAALLRGIELWTRKGAT